MKTGVNTSIIIYLNQKNKPRGKNCIKCSHWSSGFCRAFQIKITDKTNAKVCRKYSEKKKHKNTNRKKKSTNLKQKKYYQNL